MTLLINSINEVNQDELTFSQLNEHYGTGRSKTERNSQGDKFVIYRHGVMTDIGDIEISVWQELARNLIKRAGEEQLFKWLFDWYYEDIKFIKDRKECEAYVLKVHIARIFDNKKWVDYEAFNSKYRPEILKK